MHRPNRVWQTAVFGHCPLRALSQQPGTVRYISARLSISICHSVLDSIYIRVAHWDSNSHPKPFRDRHADRDEIGDLDCYTHHHGDGLCYSDSHKDCIPVLLTSDLVP
jgi:hypothetical protein